MLCGCCLEELLVQGNVPRSELQMSPQYKQSMPWTDCLYTHAVCTAATWWYTQPWLLSATQDTNKSELVVWHGW